MDGGFVSVEPLAPAAVDGGLGVIWGFVVNQTALNVYGRVFIGVVGALELIFSHGWVVSLCSPLVSTAHGIHGGGRCSSVCHGWFGSCVGWTKV